MYIQHKKKSKTLHDSKESILLLKRHPTNVRENNSNFMVKRQLVNDNSVENFGM